MTKKQGGKGKPFQKGEDPRRVHGRQLEQTNVFAREVKKCLVDAAEAVGNRMAAIANAKLPKRASERWPRELIELLHQSPEGMTSYFMWLAENHPAIFVTLFGRALPQIMQPEGGERMEAIIRTAEDIEAIFRARHIPMLTEAGMYKLPKRIDLQDPPVIDVTPAIMKRDNEQ